MRIYNKAHIKIARKELRNNATPEEKLLWSRLQNKKLKHKFHRQLSIGYFIVDFCCKELKLIIEIDGSQHNAADEKVYDTERTNYFEQLGFTVMRFANKDISTDIEGTIIKIKKVIDNLPPPFTRRGLGEVG